MSPESLTTMAKEAELASSAEKTWLPKKLGVLMSFHKSGEIGENHDAPYHREIHDSA